MGILSRLRTDVVDGAALLRIARHLPEFNVSIGRWNCARYVEERAKDQPHRTAVLFEDRRYTWREVDAEVNRYARYFRAQGIGEGDVVALMMDNRPEYLFVVTGLSRLRAVSALINTNLTGPGLTHAINVSRARAVVCGGEHLAAVEEVADGLELPQASIHVHDESGDAVAAPYRDMAQGLATQSVARPEGLSVPKTAEVMCYIYTSGTTGLPKAAIITNRRWTAAAYLFGRGMMDLLPQDVVYVVLPLYHSNGMFGGWGASVVSGATLALRRKFSASHFWSDVRKFDASVFLYIGELCRYLLNAPSHEDERAHRLRVAVGNGLRPDVWEKFQQRFSVPLVREFYGATEGNTPIVNVEGRPGMVGRLPLGMVLVRCDEATGELYRDARGRCERVEPGEKGIMLAWINPLTSFDGYLDKGATEKKIVTDVFFKGDSYFNSGDLLQLHEDRWVSFADRVGDTFRWKGENVSTNEVAEVLNDAPGVLETNVYGVTVTGAEGRAGMASVHCNDTFSLEGFARHVLQNLPSYQRPYFLRVQQDMRVTGTFKHQKVDYRKEGYDPSKVDDPLYFLEGEAYVPIDDALYAKLEAGEAGPR